MKLIRRITPKTLVAASLICGVLTSSVRPAAADDKELSLRGLVDCGAKVETSCKIKDSTFFFWTDGYGEGTQRVQIDISWVKSENLPSEIDQEDELCLTGFIRQDDQVFQATSVNEQCDEGTVNDRELQREKKNDSKDKNKN